MLWLLILLAFLGCMGENRTGYNNPRDGIWVVLAWIMFLFFIWLIAL